MGFYLRHSIGFFLQIFPCITLCYMPFKDKQYKIKKQITFLIMVLASIALSMIFPLFITDKMVNILGSVDGCANVYMLFVIALAVAFFLITIKEIAMKKAIIINIVVFYAATQFLTVNFIVPLMNTPDMEEIFSKTYVIMFLITTIILYPMAVLLMKKTIYKYIQEIEVDNVKREFNWVLNLSLINVTLMCFYAMVPKKDYESYWVTLAPSFILITVVIARLYYSLFQESITRKRNEEKKRLLEISKVQYYNIISEIDKTKRVRHDMRHHLRTIYEMAEKNGDGQIKKYVAELIEVSDKSNYEDFCDNKTLNSLLQYYIGIARSENIICAINVVCGEVNIDDTDLTVIIGNSLENAIKACKESEMQRKIYVDIGVVGSALMMQIRNTCKSVLFSGKCNLDHGFVPAKAFLSNRSNGGFGLTSIENTAEKYGGEAVFKYDDKSKLFITRIRLNFHPEIL